MLKSKEYTSVHVKRTRVVYVDRDSFAPTGITKIIE